ncbi:MAG: SEC-C domain-containing protein [Planctomycetes bacterium]|nr:SEC-C domain-containing protein [Planctomycetota bacterium]
MGVWCLTPFAPQRDGRHRLTGKGQKKTRGPNDPCHCGSGKNYKL